ncbi:MAG: hypothetical protein H7340_03030 [Variovorax sp.]|nr:hypothetical protein [Variovorax sp.]
MAILPGVAALIWASPGHLLAVDRRRARKVALEKLGPDLPQMGMHQLDLPILRIAPGHDALNAVLSGLGEGVGRRLLAEGHDVGPFAA